MRRLRTCPLSAERGGSGLKAALAHKLHALGPTLFSTGCLQSSPTDADDAMGRRSSLKIRLDTYTS